MSCGCKKCAEKRNEAVPSPSPSQRQAPEQAHDVRAAGNLAVQRSVNGQVRSALQMAVSTPPEGHCDAHAEVTDAGTDAGTPTPPAQPAPAPTPGPTRIPPTPSPTPPAPGPAPGPSYPVAITGPREVDHYCAAYVPSNAASCGVYPAPNIILRATGGAAGSVLSWSITAGANRASFAGATVGNAVSIKGDAASAARGDVTVQVTDGHTSQTHNITVRQPTTITDTSTTTNTPSRIQIYVIYTVKDQFGAAMGSGICCDETMTVCANNLAGANFVFGDYPTNASGQVSDTLFADFSPGTIPAGLCVKINQTITAGGCGPLLQNTITYQPAGITLSHGSSCAAGGSCP